MIEVAGALAPTELELTDRGRNIYGSGPEGDRSFWLFYRMAEDIGRVCCRGTNHMVSVEYIHGFRRAILIVNKYSSFMSAEILTAEQYVALGGIIHQDPTVRGKSTADPLGGVDIAEPAEE